MIWRHPFQPVAGHDDDNECTYQWPVAGHDDDNECTYQWGTSDSTYCGRPEGDHRDTLR